MSTTLALTSLVYGATGTSVRAAAAKAAFDAVATVYARYPYPGSSRSYARARRAARAAAYAVYAPGATYGANRPGARAARAAATTAATLTYYPAYARTRVYGR
jgi:hypothetical protein